MDEPTSGLDAQAAAVVMRAVKNVSNHDRTVIVTIHQPTIDVFELFDNLLLLQPGGQMAYFGPLGINSSQLLGYCESIPGAVPPAEEYNPSVWLLEVVGRMKTASSDGSAVNFASMYMVRMCSLCFHCC